MPAQQTINESAFKHWISADLVNEIGQSVKKEYPNFNKPEFLKIQKDLGPLELKARIKLVSRKLKELLPQEYPKALKIILKSMHSSHLSGFGLWPYADFIENYGLEHRELSLKALYDLTRNFTAEFAIRPYLLKYPKEVLKQFSLWASDKNEHIRRWVSEGSRPRLPWGLRLQFLVQDPTPTLPLLEKLKYDEALYVRKSVANHLNDISKDHPKLVIDLLRDWQKSAPEKHKSKIQWITRHALRGLIKKGDLKALELLGFGKQVKISVTDLKLKSKAVRVGDYLEFSFLLECLQPKNGKEQNLMIDYIVHHQKSGGKSSPKVFKLKTLSLPAKGKVTVTKRHSFRPVSTRKYYLGLHAIEIQINGAKLVRTSFNLVK